MHPVLRVLADRRDRGAWDGGARADGARVALVVEGGGGRGAFSAGMLAALDEEGLTGSFDAVFGASAGAFNAAWLLSGAMGTGAKVWGDRQVVRATVNLAAPLRGRPVVDSRHLVEEVYTRRVPLDFAAVLAHPVQFRPVATDADTGEAVDLHPLIGDVATVKRALAATANLPLLGGRPVELGGRRFLDAGVAEPVPVRAAIRWGATHALVLRTTPESTAPEPVPPFQRRFMALWLGRRAPGAARAWPRRFERETADEELLRRLGAEPAARPAVLQVRPPDTAAGRLADDRDPAQLAAAVEVGQARGRAVLAMGWGRA